MLAILSTLVALTFATPQPTKRDPELWDALTRIQHRFNLAALGEAGYWEGVVAGTVGVGAGVAVKLHPGRASVTRFAGVATPLGLAGLIALGVGEYVQARDRHPNFDPLGVPRLMEENDLETREMWQIHRFMRYRIEDQYAFALGDPYLRHYILELDRWLQVELGVLPPPAPPPRVTK